MANTGLTQKTVDQLERGVRTRVCSSTYGAGRLSLRLIAILTALSVGCSMGHRTAAAQDTEAPRKAFDFSNVETIARDLAQKAYQPPRDIKALRSLNYDDYRMIRFKRPDALWHGNSLFEVQFYHLGFLFGMPVSIHEVVDGEAQRIPYSRDWFDFDPQVAPKVPDSSDYDYAGFKITYPLHRADIQDDVAVFLGASYFRLVGRHDRFGLSARGLAIDTAEPSGEEFPYFSNFWLVRPKPSDTSITIYALLDTPSATGAYRFLIRPGQATTVDCMLTLFFRNTRRKYGLAPLTSMFMFGETSMRRFQDFRPEVHDSDGLLMQTGAGGEWLFRPLENPRRGVRTSRFLDLNPRGFGLIQRDRRYGNYLDLETHYEGRPDIWIEPRGEWGAGSVELVEIPSDRETNDNIVAYWVPQSIADDKLTLHYQMTTGRGYPQPSVAQVLRTLSETPQKVEGEFDPEKMEARRFVVDFGNTELRGLAENQPIHPELSVSNGRFSNLYIVKDESSGEWRVSFVAVRDKDKAADMHLTLTLHGQRLSERWVYLWDNQV